MSYQCIKIMLIGDTASGKSCLLRRYVENEFTSAFPSTLGIDCRIKTLTIDGRAVKLQIWDTAGQERFGAVTCSYYRGAQAVLFVYDISNRVSFVHLDEWYRQCARYADNPITALIGSKSDLKRQVGYQEAMDWAEEHDCPLVECSSKNSNDHNRIEALFQQVAKECLARSQKPVEGNTIVVNELPRQRSRCC